MYAAISIDAEVPVSFDAPGDIDGIIEISHQQSVPITWLLYSGATRPEQVIRYYHDEVMHRIPGYHEIGLHVHFDDHRLENYVTDPTRRRELILRGAEVLRKYHVKPTSFRAGCWCLQLSDVEVLEEAGILVDGSACTGFRSPNHPGHGDWRGLSFRGPYRPSYSSLAEKGTAKVTFVPTCSSPECNAQGSCDCGYLEYRGWSQLEPILDWYAENEKFVSLGAHDGRTRGECPAPGEVMEQAIAYLRERGYKFTTLTQMRNFWLQGERDE